MKKFLLSFILVAVTLTGFAQNIGEAFYIYRNDGEFNSFFCDEVKSIEYSYEDIDGIKYDEIVTQVVTTADSVYKIPLSVIDSVSFVKPKATYKEDVTYLDASLFDYIVSVNGQDITFRSDTPENLLPQIGDKIATVDLTNIFPYGFLGIVSAIDNVPDGIRIRCNSLALEDAVSRFYGIIQFDSHQEVYSSRRAYSVQPLKIKDFGPITKSFEIPNSMIERKDVMSYGGRGFFKIAVDPDLNIVLTIAIDENKDILSYNARINHVVQLTEEKEIVGIISKEWKNTFYTQDFPLIWGFTFYFDLGLKAGLSGELALGHNSSTTLRAGMDWTFYPKKPLDSKVVHWLYKSDGDNNLLYLAGKVEGKLGAYFGMGLGLINHGLAKLGCEFELGVKGTAEFALNLGELPYKTSTTCYDNCKDQKADLSLYLGAYLVTSMFEGDNKIIDDYVGNKGWWDEFSIQFSTGNDWDIAKLYEGYMLPHFEHVSFLRHGDDKTKAEASYSIPYNSIQKCKIGFMLFDSEGNFLEQKFYPEFYSNKAESSPLYPLTFTGLNPKEVYTIYPCINVLENDMLASPKYSEDMVLLLLDDAEEVEFNSAKLSGRVVPNDGWKGRKVFFQYAKVSKLSMEGENWQSVDAVYDEEQKSYSLILADLAPATNYKYRMACNNYGEELYSEEKSFKTKDYEVTVDNVTMKTPYSASLLGHIMGYDPNHGHVFFNYTTDWTNGIWNEVDANYDADTGLFTAKLNNLKPATRYFFKLIYVIYEDTYESIPFNFVTNDLSKELPVIFKFQQANSTYQPDGFTYKGDLYSFEYGSAVTCQWSVAENAEDFGYVYEDLKGDTAHVSLKKFSSPYTDTRYVYYRNEPMATAKLYTYIKYQGDDVYYHTEERDYNLIFDKLPQPVTSLPIEASTNSAKLKCKYHNVLPWSGTCGIEYWEDTHINDSKKIYFDTAQEEIEVILDGLKPNTTYYYQALIKVDDKYVGDVTGIEKNEILADEIMSFTTKPVFVLTTGEVKDKTANSATLSGTVENYDPNDETFQFAFFYSTSSDVMNAWDGKSVVATYDNNGNLMAEISGLTDYTTYYYTLAVKRGESAFESSETKSFTTLPVVSTVNNATTTSNSATLSGTCSKGITVTGFAVKKDGASEYATYSAVVDGSGNFSATIDGLEANTTYRYYAFIKDGEKTYPGEEYRFTTKQLPVTVATGTTSNVTANSATLSGTVENYDPSDESVQFVFFYSTSSDVMNATDGKSVVASYDNNGHLTAEIIGLADYTDYYYTLAIKRGDAAYETSEVNSFKTLPFVTTSEDVATTINSATLKGTCSKGIYVAGFAIKKDGESDYTQYSAWADSEGNFTATIDNLEINTKYVFYAFIQNDDVTYKGEGLSFSTKELHLCPDNNHPHMIDLGLPSGTKWACCNVGASMPEDYGEYYAWGETQTYNRDRPYAYSSSDNNYVYIGTDISGTEYDIAHVKWGEQYQMPNYEQGRELFGNCTSVWKSLNGVAGRIFTGPNGNTIFIPAGGVYWYDVFYAGKEAYYWTSKNIDDIPGTSWSIYFDSNGGNVTNGVYRHSGMLIRPVQEVVKVTTGEAKNIKESSATLTGTVENYDPSDESVQFAFFYSTSSDVINASDGKSVAATYDNNGHLTAEITGLSDYTDYYYTLVIKRGDAAYETSEVNSFKTLPFVTTSEDVATTINSATLKGTCSKGIYVAGFAIKKDGESDYTQYSAWADSKGNFTATIDNLEINTKYNFYAFIQNDDVTYKGEELTFNTKGIYLCPDNNHPHMIDLGLPSGTKWACCNVGASSPEEYGNYYAWGETQQKSVYNWDTYKYGYYNYDDDFSHLVNIGSDIAGTSYDVATANWGAPWRMPSWEQIKELLYNTISTWTTQNGVSGRQFTGFNGGTVFLPAAGVRSNSGLYSDGTSAFYWSSSLYESYLGSAYDLDFSSKYVLWGSHARFTGLSVRPVR